MCNLTLEGSKYTKIVREGFAGISESFEFSGAEFF
jgi:hypothetical protein